MNEVMVFHSDFDDFETWRALLREQLPDIDVCRPEQVEDPEAVHYALVWKAPTGFFGRWPRLELIVNLGAGVDALVRRDDLPDQVPITRLSDPDMARMMAGYVLFAVLRYARDIPYFEHYQRLGKWRYRHPRAAGDIRVGVMGLGELGGLAASELARQGFNVSGWSRSAKKLAGITCHAGISELDDFLARNEIIVVMLPSTPETRGLLNEERLRRLPYGAKLINVSRGDIVDEAALIELLRAGHLGGATLDVFEHEPLPLESPLWRLDNVLITPHLASVALPASTVEQITDNIRRLRRGEAPIHQIDPSRGY